MRKNKPSLKGLCGIGLGIVALGFLLLFLGGRMLGKSSLGLPVFLLGGLTALGGVAFQGFTLRCPHCGCSLAFRSRVLPDFCPECGKPLDPEEKDSAE